MNYAPIVSAFSAAVVADGAAIALLVEARAAAGFNGETFMVAIDAMLTELVANGTIQSDTAGVRRSMIKKLATITVDVLIDAAAQGSGLSKVYKLACDASPKTSNAGAKKKTATKTKTKTVAASAAATELISLMDVLRKMQEIRNTILPKVTSDMGILEDCDAFIATMAAKVGIKI
jgi:hypothetical protein